MQNKSALKSPQNTYLNHTDGIWSCARLAFRVQITSSLGFFLHFSFIGLRANEFECRGRMLPLFKSPRIAEQTYLIIQFFVFHLVNCIVPRRRWQDVLRVLFVHAHFILLYLPIVSRLAPNLNGIICHPNPKWRIGKSE